MSQNSFDARRPMRECENLDEIFTVQDERKVSENLTLNHKRVLYVLEDTVENRRPPGVASAASGTTSTRSASAYRFVPG